jgi:hypothetical protein
LLAVNPDLTIVIDVGLKKDPGAGYGDAVYLFGELQGEAIPSEGKADRPALANVRAKLPAGVVIIR